MCVGVCVFQVTFVVGWETGRYRLSGCGAAVSAAS